MFVSFYPPFVDHVHFSRTLEASEQNNKNSQPTTTLKASRFTSPTRSGQKSIVPLAFVLSVKIVIQHDRVRFVLCLMGTFQNLL